MEFYINDTPINGGAVLQQMYDIQQIEVLRGPQGTLRGRASPSGAITVTTRKPDLWEPGAYVSATGNDIGTLNFNGAVGVPIVEGIAAIRVAGLYDVGEGNRVKTLSPTAIDGRDPYDRSTGARVSLALQPADWLNLEGVYQYLDTNSRQFDHVESANLADPSQPAGPFKIDPEDRRSIEDSPTYLRQRYDLYTWKAEADLLGQNLIYVGNYRSQKVRTNGDDDAANFFPGFSFGQFTNSRSYDEAHELRLQNEERVAGLFDYVIGAFRQNNNPPTDLIQQTPILLPPFLGGGIATVNETPIQRVGPSQETSFFGNLNFYIGDKFEIGGGLRYIKQKAESVLVVGDNTLIDEDTKDDKLIYNASANYFVTPDVMLYANTGTSFRPEKTAIGNFSVQQSPLQQQFTTIPPEESTSYEVGVKSRLFDGKLLFNLSAYYQEFENFPYRPPGTGVFFQSFAEGPTDDPADDIASVGNFNFIAAVPVEVKGIEAEIGYELTPNWSVNLVAAYADGQIKDGVVPCNDLNGDGEPDALSAPPTLGEVQAAYGTDNVGSCTVNQRAGFTAPFSATLQSEYNFLLSDRIEGFGRGLFSFFGKSKGDPQNRFDDVDAYGLLNLYAGIRDPEGAWEVSLFGKNVLDAFEVVSRSDSIVRTNFQVLQPPTFMSAQAGSATAPYRSITTTAPQEFGVNVRFAFGSR